MYDLNWQANSRLEHDGKIDRSMCIQQKPVCSTSCEKSRWAPGVVIDYAAQPSSLRAIIFHPCIGFEDGDRFCRSFMANDFQYSTLVGRWRWGSLLSRSLIRDFRPPSGCARTDRPQLGRLANFYGVLRLNVSSQGAWVGGRSSYCSRVLCRNSCLKSWPHLGRRWVVLRASPQCEEGCSSEFVSSRDLLWV